jgi:hypothetical protein
MFRRAVTAAVAGALLAMITGLTTPASAATPTCTGAGCDGKAVSATNCHDNRAYAIDGYHAADNSIIFDLWYSPSCKAMWGDYQININTAGLASLYGIAPYGGSGIAKELWVQTTGLGQGDVSTTLVNSMQAVKFCSHISPGLPISDKTTFNDFTCTGWR